MKPTLERAGKALVPVLAVAVVLLASYFVPVQVSGPNLTSCAYTSPVPTVTNVSPNSGTTTGGTTVTITGTQFCNGAVTVMFGTTAGTGVVVNSNTQVTVVSPAEAAGTVHVTVTTAGGTSATSTADQFTYMIICASAGLSPDKASPQIVGTTITFTATSTGCTSPEYLFYLQPPGGAWMVVQGYGGPTFVWNTTGLAVGTYNVDVWVRQIGSGVSQQAFFLITFTLSPIPACTSAGLSPDKASPQMSGTIVTFTATSATCTNPEYLFFVQAPGGPWMVAQGYDGPTFVWNTAGLAAGTYAVDVWVRQIGSGVSQQTFLLINYTLGPIVPCTAAGLSPDKASPQASGTIVTFTGSSATCSQPQYLFYVQAPGGPWMVAQGYDGPTFVWNTAGLAAGTYNVDVWVRQNGSTAAEETFHLITFTLGPIVPCTAAGLSPDKASPQMSGTIVTFTGTSATCSQPQYLFYVQAPGGPWTVAQGYDGPTFVWDTAGLAAGTYNVDVWVRQNGSTAAEETFHLITFTLTAPLACASAGLSPDKASPQAVGTTVTFTATSLTCSQPQYLFYVKSPSGVWTVAQGYGSPTFVWNTAGLPAGTYAVDVWVRQNGSPAPEETFLLINYTLT